MGGEDVENATAASHAQAKENSAAEEIKEASETSWPQHPKSNVPGEKKSQKYVSKSTSEQANRPGKSSSAHVRKQPSECQRTPAQQHKRGPEASEQHKPEMKMALGRRKENQQPTNSPPPTEAKAGMRRQQSSARPFSQEINLRFEGGPPPKFRRGKANENRALAKSAPRKLKQRIAADIQYMKQTPGCTSRHINYNLFKNYSLPISEIKELFSEATLAGVVKRCVMGLETPPLQPAAEETDEKDQETGNETEEAHVSQKTCPGRKNRSQWQLPGPRGEKPWRGGPRGLQEKHTQEQQNAKRSTKKIRVTGPTEKQKEWMQAQKAGEKPLEEAVRPSSKNQEKAIDLTHSPEKENGQQGKGSETRDKSLEPTAQIWEKVEGQEGEATPPTDKPHQAHTQEKEKYEKQLRTPMRSEDLTDLPLDHPRIVLHNPGRFGQVTRCPETGDIEISLTRVPTALTLAEKRKMYEWERKSHTSKASYHDARMKHMVRCPLYSCIHQMINQRQLRSSIGIHFREYRNSYPNHPIHTQQEQQKEQGESEASQERERKIAEVLGARVIKKREKQQSGPKKHTQPSILEALRRMQNEEKKKKHAEQQSPGNVISEPKADQMEMARPQGGNAEAPRTQPSENTYSQVDSAPKENNSRDTEEGEPNSPTALSGNKEEGINQDKGLKPDEPAKEILTLSDFV